MMMNERVEIGASAGADAGRTATGVDEKLVVLHRTLKRIAKARAHLDLQEAEALREAQRLQLWRELGHTSLADYMVQELGYASHRVADERLRLANALPQLPVLTQALQNGEINFSQARELARVVTPETEAVWVEKAQEMNVREVEQAVAGHHKGDLPEDPIDHRLVRKTIWMSVRPETEVLFREAKRKLERERGERVDEDALLESVCRAFLAEPVVRVSSVAEPVAHAASADLSVSSAIASASSGHSEARGDDRDGDSRERGQRSAPRGSDQVSVPRGSDQVSVPRGSDQGSAPRGPDQASSSCDVEAPEAAWLKAAFVGAPYRVAVTVCKECKRGWQHGGGLVAEMTPAAVAKAECDAQWIGDLDTNHVERARQEISPATRRKVLHRDQNRCRVPGCMCFTNLDVHHLFALMYGGTNEIDNLITLCEAHHLALHAGTLIIERENGELVFRQEGRNRFTRATREVETRQALRERGFDREHVKEIMARTIAHVGANELSAERWLEIALGYAKTIRCSGCGGDRAAPGARAHCDGREYAAGESRQRVACEHGASRRVGRVRCAVHASRTAPRRPHCRRREHRRIGCSVHASRRTPHRLLGARIEHIAASPISARACSHRCDRSRSR